MSFRSVFVVALLLLGLSVPASVLAQDYTVGTGDILKVVVWGHDDLSKDYPIAPDGYMPFPLIGRVKAEGLTVQQLAERIRVPLEKDYLVNPQVIVSVREYLSQ